MENVNWGVPTRNRNKKTEKYDTPVLTMVALGDKGTARKFCFNKALVEALNIVGGETKVNFGFGPEGIYLGTFDEGLLVKKNNSFSDRKTYDYLTKVLNLDSTVENELHFTSLDNGFLISKYPSDEIEEAEITVLDVSEETAEKLEEIKEEVAENLTPEPETLDEQW